MKKKILSLSLAAAMVLSMAACSSGGGTSSGSSGSSSGSSENSSASSDNSSSEPSSSSDNSSTPAASGPISLRVWGAEEDQALLSTLVDEFKAAYPDYEFNIEIGVESESTAKDTILTDVSAAADVFAFADDQLNDLIAANALANIDDIGAAFEAISGKTVDDIKAANNEGSVAAATRNGSLYALPMGGGNNFFLYYDSSVLSETDVQTWDGLLSAASAAGKQVGMTFASGWYNAGFFLGAGFTSRTNEDGSTYIDWNGTSPDGYTGVQVVEGMLNIANSPAFMPVTDGDLSNQIASGALCAVVDGTWDAGACETAWGEGYAATKLPTFTVNGNQVQQYCYSGFKLMGVNALSQNVGWAAVLAEYLTNESSQTKRFEARQLSPTNKNAAANDAVAANIAIAASAAQDNFGVIQDVGGNYWDPTKTFGELIAQKQLTVGDTEGIQAALDNLVAGVTAPTA